ncbi:hypothetical protein [Fodinibius halophilus]|uniref:6-bladed beta-propeller n=1 Tax=Fodinibius halophilus TaxID=1736908 RepID=A0A6M1TN42_9BACT|nr:hypothetical protein [Fodinibius halophilus]NGP89770.1 hypothetical protein [Fodinibius halophilus]
MKRRYWILIILILFGCSNKKEFPGMPEQQEKLLSEHQQKSVNLSKSFESSDLITVRQNGNIKAFPFTLEKLDSTTFEHPESIGISKLIETENYFFLDNIVLSPNGYNTAKYDKKGTFLASFARKGRGPGEKTTRGVIVERNDTTYLFDNGYIKLFDETLTEIDRTFIGLWAYQAFIDGQGFDLNIASNEYFPYPVTRVDKKSYDIQMSLMDDRSDIFNVSVSNSKTFFSNDELIIYAKTTLNLIHVIEKKSKSFAHYEIISEIIRENEDSIEKGATPDELVSFLENLFVIEKLHYKNQTLWILFRDGGGDNLKRYLGKVTNLRSLDSSADIEIYDLKKIGYKHNYSFFNNHINVSDRIEGDKKTFLYQIKLNQL